MLKLFMSNVIYECKILVSFMTAKKINAIFSARKKMKLFKNAKKYWDYLISLKNAEVF